MTRVPLKPAEATERVRELGHNPRLTITYSEHFKQRLHERDLIIGDALFLLKRGFIFSAPELASQPGLFKYAMETRTPNSGNRTVRAIIIPDFKSVWVKFVTIMWADE